MGLDVYLYKYENFDDTQKRESEYSEQSQKNWDFNGKPYNQLTDEEKEKARQDDLLLAEKLGLNESGDDPRKEKIEINSKFYPEHYFKIGYFRSSYNESGINRILKNLGLQDLHEIFEVDGEYEFQPDWNKVLDNTLQVIKNLSAIIENGDNYRCTKFDWNEFAGDPNKFPIDSEQEALKLFLSEKNDRKGTGDYSNSKGAFYFDDPLKVSGVISGVNKRIFVDQKLPCSYLIYKDESLDWYLQALKIVVETIEFVLRQKDINKYYLHWSS